MAPSLLCLFVLDSSSHDASRKDEQTDARGRTEDGGGGGKQWALVHDSGALGVLIIPQWKGRGRFITFICPTITDPQLIPTTKEVTMASQWTATYPHPVLSQQCLAELLGAALPHGWGQAPLRPLKSQCKKKIIAQQRGFPGHSLPPQQQKIHLKPFQTPLNVCLWTGHQMLALRADTPFFQTGRWGV